MKTTSNCFPNECLSDLVATLPKHGQQAQKRYALWSHTRQRFLPQIFFNKEFAEMNAFSKRDVFVVEFIVPSQE